MFQFCLGRALLPVLSIPSMHIAGESFVHAFSYPYSHIDSTPFGSPDWRHYFTYFQMLSTIASEVALAVVRDGPRADFDSSRYLLLVSLVRLPFILWQLTADFGRCCQTSSRHFHDNTRLCQLLVGTNGLGF